MNLQPADISKCLLASHSIRNVKYAYVNVPQLN